VEVKQADASVQLEARDDGFEDAAVFLEILRRAGGGYGEEPVFLLGNDPQGPDRGLGGPYWYS